MTRSAILSRHTTLTSFTFKLTHAKKSDLTLFVDMEHAALRLFYAVGSPDECWYHDAEDGGKRVLPRIISAAFSAIIITGE